MSFELQNFTGLTFERRRGRICLSRDRVWKLRQAIRHVLSVGWASGDELRIIIGHYTWSCLLKRCLLSIFSSVYKFISKAGDRRWRVWPSVRRELWHACVLLPFAFVDTQKPIDPVVVATDASGSSAVDAGGFAVVERTWPEHAVRNAVSQADRWRP